MGSLARGVYGPGDCRSNAGEVIGVRTVSGTLDLSGSAIIGLHGQTSFTYAPSTAVSTSHSTAVHIADTEIAEINTLAHFTAAQQPASPYCPPPPSSAVGIASNGDSQVQITRNDLHDIAGINLNGSSIGIAALLRRPSP